MSNNLFLFEDLSKDLDKISQAESLTILANLEQELLGKSSKVALAREALKQVEPNERPELGKRLNFVRNQLQNGLDQRRKVLVEGERQKKLQEEKIDLGEILTSPQRGHIHLIAQTQQSLEDVFIGMGYTVEEGPEVETEWYNFEALNIPPSHPARDAQDSLYVKLGKPGSTLLRTHTSPVQIRVMQNNSLPIYSVMPGRVYRRDTPDARHTPAFHQIEGLVVDKDISFSDLAGTIETFTSAYFGPAIKARLRPAFFPFTEPSAEFDITCTICEGSGCRTCSGVGWVELGGCGMIDPAVFASVGIDSEQWSGFAFGFGIDRCAQMKHGIDDMRVLLDNDIRFLSQF